MKSTAGLLWWYRAAPAVAAIQSGAHMGRLLGFDADLSPASQEGSSETAVFFNSRHGHSEEQLCGFNSTHLHASWEAYAELHRQGRTAMERGEPVKVLIWHCRSGEDCRGNGDQIRGLSMALYLAIATSRVLLVDWSRNGAEITDLFSVGHIDWRLPADGLDCQSSKGIKWWAVTAPKKPVEALRDMSEQCVYLMSNKSPEDQNLAQSAGLDGVVHLWRGCAFNFLFREAQQLVRLLHSRLPRLSSEPSQAGGVPYVGVHLRFGDEIWGKHSYMMQPGEKVVEAALGCAVQVGQSLFAPQEEWDVLLVTDNLDVKKMATTPSWASPIMLRHGRNLSRVPNVFTTIGDDGRLTEPAHTNFLKDAGESKEVQTLVLDAWADQFSLARAEGILATFGSFAVSAAEIGLLPRGAVWHFDGDTGACEVHGGATAIRASSSRNKKR